LLKQKKILILRKLLLRYIFSIILVLTLFFVSDGYHLYYLYLQNQQKRSVEEKIKEGSFKEELSIINIKSKNSDDLQWIKINKEFRFKGDLYDIVKVEHLQTSTRYFCIKDVKEKKLESRFINNLKRRRNKLQKLRQNLNLKFLQTGNNFKTNNQKIIVEHKLYSNTYKSGIIDISSPPPRIFS